MPVPKRKRSKASTRSHRAHQAITLPTTVECPHCHRPMKLHHACPACGFYRGRDVLNAETELA
jgi:large subunit ribosomal protein L32